MFFSIFRLDPNERVTLQDLTKHRLFQQKKQSPLTLTCASTESESDEDAGFEKDKLQFVEGILGEVKTLKFLSQWEELCFEYYIRKMCLALMGSGKEGEEGRKKAEKAVSTLGKHIECNIAEQKGIPRLKDYYSPVASSFQ